MAILRGIIVGTHQSGKTSLLRRLRDEEITTGTTGETRKLMALVPWEVPNDIDCVKDDEVVQLYLSEGTSFTSYNPDSKDARDVVESEWKEIFCNSATSRKQVKKHLDFMVWMIDTRQESEHVLEFVKMSLECLYPPIQREDGENCQDEIDSKQLTASPQNLCILLNFRDLQDNRLLLQQIRDVASALLDNACRATSNNNPTASPCIAVYESSMLTNYGMPSLQSFISLPYMQYKEREYERRIDDLRRGYDTTKKSLLTQDDETDSYDQYIQQQEQAKKQVTSPLKRQNSSNTKNENKLRSDSLELARSIDKQIEESIPKVERSTQRKLFPSSQQTEKPTTTWTPLDNTNQNLDSFFSDDESDENHEEELSIQQQEELEDDSSAILLSNDAVLDSDDDDSALEGNETHTSGSSDKAHTNSTVKIATNCIDGDEAEEKKEDAVVSTKGESAEAQDYEESTDVIDQIHNESQDGEAIVRDNELSKLDQEIVLTGEDDQELAECDKAKVMRDSTPDEEAQKHSIDETVESSHNPLIPATCNDNGSADLKSYASKEEDALEGNSPTTNPQQNDEPSQSQVLLDSDDESVDNIRRHTNERNEKINRAHDHTQEKVVIPVQQPSKTLVQTKPSVSNAALAAIEAARLEAERALADTNTKNKEKKSKKEKKKSKSKKSKKKEIEA